MTLEEAIVHAEERGRMCLNGSVVLEENGLHKNAKEYKKCGEEHMQLAEWLKELRERRWNDR